MWGEEDLHRLNEEAVHDHNVRRSEKNIRIKPWVFPLTIMARKLMAGPPSLGHIADLLANSECIESFVGLIREYIPEWEEEIMSKDIDFRTAEFAKHFNPAYFPLSGSVNDMTVEEFVSDIPVDLMGFNSDDYHNFADFRPGFILMLALVDNPYDVEDEPGYCSPSIQMGGGRMPILDMTGTIVRDLDLVASIPEKGFSLKDIHKMVDNHPVYEAFGLFADWVHSDTQCSLLNATYNDYGPEMWERGEVDALTEEWPIVKEFWDRVDAMATWIEKGSNFKELVEFLLSFNKVPTGKKGKGTKLVQQKTLKEILNAEEDSGDSGDGNNTDLSTGTDRTATSNPVASLAGV